MHSIRYQSGSLFLTINNKEVVAHRLLVELFKRAIPNPFGAMLGGDLSEDEAKELIRNARDTARQVVAIGMVKGRKINLRFSLEGDYFPNTIFQSQFDFNREHGSNKFQEALKAATK